MPRQRQRIVFCDCFDCRDRPEYSLSPEQLDAATAVARQEPPPKALLIYATGFVIAADGATNLDACTLPHCNLVVREGNLGLLAVRAAEATTGPRPEPAVSELSQLLGVYQEAVAQQQSAAAAEGGDGSLPSLAARFKGMQSAFASTSAAARQLAQRLGMAVVERLSIQPPPPAAAADGVGGADAPAATAPASAPPAGGADGTATVGRSAPLGLPDAASFAGAVSAELGAAEGSSGRDLLLLHLDLGDLIGAPEAGAGGAGAGSAAAAGGGDTNVNPDADAASEALWECSCEALEWLDSLVKALLVLPEIRERTLLVLMLSPAGRRIPPGVAAGQQAAGTAAGGTLLQPGGAALDPSAAVVTPRSAAQVGRGGGGAAAAAAAAAAGGGGGLSVLDAGDYPLVSRPMQSFEVLGMARVEADPRAPVLVARRLPGVVRRDRAERLSYREALSAGGSGAVLVDRLLPEVAYKIGRAPKYGA